MLLTPGWFHVGAVLVSVLPTSVPSGAWIWTPGAMRVSAVSTTKVRVGLVPIALPLASNAVIVQL